jgi:excisionase family DNA binding protein
MTKTRSGPDDEVLTIGFAELAELLGISISTARRLYRSGKLPLRPILPTRRNVRFSRAAVRLWIRRSSRV